MEGRQLQKHTLIRELKRFQRRANFSTDWALLDLRMSIGVIFLRNGGTLRKLQTFMGHERPYQTEQTYRRFLTGNTRDLDAIPAVQGTDAISTSYNEFREF